MLLLRLETNNLRGNGDVGGEDGAVEDEHTEEPLPALPFHNSDSLRRGRKGERGGSNGALLRPPPALARRFMRIGDDGKKFMVIITASCELASDCDFVSDRIACLLCFLDKRTQELLLLLLLLCCCLLVVVQVVGFRQKSRKTWRHHFYGCVNAYGTIPVDYYTFTSRHYNSLIVNHNADRFLLIDWVDMILRMLFGTIRVQSWNLDFHIQNGLVMRHSLGANVLRYIKHHYYHTVNVYSLYVCR